MDYCNYKHVNNPLARDRVEYLNLNLDLTDIWRDLNAESRFFSHFGTHGSVCRANGYPVWIPVRPFYACSEIFIKNNNRKHDRISRKIVIKSIKKGGMWLRDIRQFIIE